MRLRRSKLGLKSGVDDRCQAVFPDDSVGARRRAGAVAPPCAVPIRIQAGRALRHRPQGSELRMRELHLFSETVAVQERKSGIQESDEPRPCAGHLAITELLRW